MANLVPYQYDSMTHRVAYRTDVIPAKDGTETRVALSGEPRESFEIVYQQMSESELQQVRRWLMINPNGVFRVPLRHEAIVVIQATGDHNTETVCDFSKSDWVVVDQRVFIEDDDGTYIESTIESVASDRFVVGDAQAALGTSIRRVMPLVSLLLNDGQNMARRILNVGEWHLSGSLQEPNLVFGTGATVGTFDSLPVLNRRPLGADLIQEQFPANLQVADYDAAISVYWGQEVGNIKRDHQFNATGDAERQWWKKLHSTVLGRQGSFLLPTWRDDLVIDTQPSGTGFIVADVPEYSQLWLLSPGQRRIQLLLSNGTVAYHRVTAVEDNMDGTLTLTITPTFAGGTVVQVSLLETVRFYDDAMVWTHFGNRSVIPASMLVTQPDFASDEV